jgi:hypothetical protein
LFKRKEIERMPRKMKKPTKKAAEAYSLLEAVDAVASAMAMSVIAQHGSKAERAEAVGWLKGWFSEKRVFRDSKR